MPAEVHDRKRYPQAVDPAATDGRGIDMSLGTLSGEAAEQAAKRGAGRATRSEAVDEGAFGRAGVAHLL